MVEIRELDTILNVAGVPLNVTPVANFRLVPSILTTTSRAVAAVCFYESKMKGCGFCGDDQRQWKRAGASARPLTETSATISLTELSDGSSRAPTFHLNRNCPGVGGQGSDSQPSRVVACIAVARPGCISTA